jgi:uncharacterized membrane protein YheB (UPF0754 family)
LINTHDVNRLLSEFDSINIYHEPIRSQFTSMNLESETGSQTESKEHFKNLWKLLVRHSKWDTLKDEKSVRMPERPFLIKRRSRLLLLLKFIPWILLISFFFSFYWDFTGLEITLLGNIYPAEGLLRIISVSGLIGFLTNWLAITMLFRPAKKRPLLGHGLIPAQKDRIAFRLATAVSKDLINPEIIKKKIQDSGVISKYRELASDYIKAVIDNPEFRSDLKQWVVDYVQAMIGDPEVRTSIAEKLIAELDESLEERSLEKVALKTYTFLKGKEMQDIVEESLVRLPATVEKGLIRFDEFLDRLPEHIENESDKIETLLTQILYRLVNQLDVFSLVEENLKNFDEGRLEQLIKGATNEQLTYIQYLGGILGTIGGLVIWQPLLSLAVLTCLFLIVLFTDQILSAVSPDKETNLIQDEYKQLNK